MSANATAYLTAVLILGALLTVAPGVSACSLASEPPAPGAFFVWDPDSGDLWRVPVEDRGLGAGCELSNPHDFDGTRLAWAAGDDQGPSVHIVDLATGDEQVVRPSGHGVRDVGLAGDELVHVSNYNVAGERYDQPRVVALHLETGRERTLPLPTGDRFQYRLNGPVVLALDWSHDAQKRLTLYDAAQDGWLVRDRTPSALGAAHDAHVAGFSGSWIVFESESRATAFDLARGVGHDVTDAFVDRRVLAVDGDRAYVFGWSSKDGGSVVQLPDGNERSLPAPPHLALGPARDGYVVLGAYSAPDPVDVPPYRPPDGEALNGSPVSPIVALMAAGSAALVGRRWMRG